MYQILVDLGYGGNWTSLSGALSITTALDQLKDVFDYLYVYRRRITGSEVATLQRCQTDHEDDIDIDDVEDCVWDKAVNDTCTGDRDWET